jgi:ATP synthase protein I
MKDTEPGALDKRRQALEDKLAQRVEVEKKQEARQNRDNSGFARGLKIASEFVAGVLVGAGIGWLIDKGLDTTPWFFITFLMLGFAAGVLNVLRAEGMGPTS